MSGSRSAVISILGSKVIAPRGLIGLGHDTLKYSGAEIREVFNVLAEEDTYPTLIHCTRGKDRTGLIVILLLLLLLPTVSTTTTTNSFPSSLFLEAVSADYDKSEHELARDEKQKEEQMQENRDHGLTEEFLRCPQDFAEQAKGHLDSVYGGVESYLESIGVEAETMERIRRMFLV
jgi:protein-tyrosine phosphatase